MSMGISRCTWRSVAKPSQSGTCHSRSEGSLAPLKTTEGYLSSECGDCRCAEYFCKSKDVGVHSTDMCQCMYEASRQAVATVIF